MRQGKFGVDARRAVDAAVSAMDLHDALDQLSILDSTSSRDIGRPLVVARAGHPQHPAGHRDVDPVGGELTDQPEPYFGSTFSRAK